MRIVIDCFKQVKGAGKSIGIYNLSLNLVKNLAAESQNSTDEKIRKSEIVVLGNAHNEVDFNISGVKFVKIAKYNPLNKVHCVFWELVAVTDVCKKVKADRIIFPRGYCAIRHPIKDIVIIHDLIPFYYNEYYPDVFWKVENAYIMARLKKSAQNSNRIITISDSSKKDIMKYCGVNGDKIVVIHNGCNAVYAKKYEKEAERPYIIAVTSKLPHKNAIGILKSYEKYCEISNCPLELVVIGIEDVSSVCELPDLVKKKIRCYKFIESDLEMHEIIAKGKVMLFLSLIEGFGYPPIEAMQLGVPVICSNQSSLPEVVAEAAILVNPTDFDEIAERMNELLCNKVMQKELIKKGYKNAERFSWDSRAKLYWKAILNV